MADFNRTNNITTLQAIGIIFTQPAKMAATILKESAQASDKLADAIPVAIKHATNVARHTSLALDRANAALLRSYSDDLGRKVTMADIDTDAKRDALAMEMAFRDWKDPVQQQTK